MLAVLATASKSYKLCQSILICRSITMTTTELRQGTGSTHEWILPPGWVAVQSAKDNKVYYWNKKTGATTWKFPDKEGEGYIAHKILCSRLVYMCEFIRRCLLIAWCSGVSPDWLRYSKHTLLLAPMHCSWLPQPQLGRVLSRIFFGGGGGGGGGILRCVLKISQLLMLVKFSWQ